MKLDKHSNVPLYAQLKDLLLERIQQGVYAAGSQIPSELLLCDELQLSRPTVRQAIAELVAEGTLVIIKGKGTFVSAEPDRLEIPGFSPFTFSLLSQRSLEGIDLQATTRLEGDEETDRAFNAAGTAGNPGYWSFTWPLQDGDTIMGWCQSVIPIFMFPDLAESLQQGKRMIDITANKYAYLPQKGSCRIFVRAATNDEARQLDISRRSPVLAVTCRLVSRSGNVCETVRAVLRPDLVTLGIDGGRS
jgi:DNA-binding GntR family transcriptional regulator